jgi:hypothetical protein
MLTRLPLKQKLLLEVCLSVLISALVTGRLNLTLLGSILEKHLIEQELPIQSQSTRKDVEKDLDRMTNTLSQLAKITMP